jgi:hypothetical protein
MDVTIRYLQRGHSRPVTLVLSPSDYLDPVDPGESLETDGIPRFSHAREYLPLGIDVEWTELTDARGASVTRVREVFSSDGRVSHWHRTDPDGGEELCVSSQLSAQSTHIVRMVHMPSGEWEQLFNVVIADHADGTQIETVLFSGKAPETRPSLTPPAAPP